jgi:hypothetical protein
MPGAWVTLFGVGAGAARRLVGPACVSAGPDDGRPGHALDVLGGGAAPPRRWSGRPPARSTSPTRRLLRGLADVLLDFAGHLLGNRCHDLLRGRPLTASPPTTSRRRADTRTKTAAPAGQRDVGAVGVRRRWHANSPAPRGEPANAGLVVHGDHVLAQPGTAAPIPPTTSPAGSGPAGPRPAAPTPGCRLAGVLLRPPLLRNDTGLRHLLHTVPGSVDAGIRALGDRLPVGGLELLAQRPAAGGHPEAPRR